MQKVQNYCLGLNGYECLLLWHPLTECVLWRKEWKQTNGPALKELAESLVWRRMGKHTTPYDIKTVLWLLCPDAVGMHKRGTWPYPEERVAGLRLKAQLQPAQEEAKKGDLWTQGARTFLTANILTWFSKWLGCPWGSRSILFESGWPEPALDEPVHPDGLTTELLGSEDQVLVPLYFLPFKVILVSICNIFL